MKINYKTYFLLILVSLIFASTTTPADGRDEPVNSISIQGASNVNEFVLTNDNPVLNVSGNSGGRYRDISIAVDGFTAENNKMVDDFREMVNASENPYIHLAIERRDLADFEETSGLTVFNTIITVAGESDEYDIPLEVVPDLNAGYTLKGKFSLKLTDFGTKPPEKFFGLIKVKNIVFVDFTFNFDGEESLTRNQ